MRPPFRPKDNDERKDLAKARSEAIHFSQSRRVEIDSYHQLLKVMVRGLLCIIMENNSNSMGGVVMERMIVSNLVYELLTPKDLSNSV